MRVSDGDMGRVIGKRGRVANAIRTVVRAAASRDGVDVDAWECNPRLREAGNRLLQKESTACCIRPIQPLQFSSWT